jgi:hypothetical protein
MLINTLKEPCVFMLRNSSPDGSGGDITNWTEGAQFDAAITLDTSAQAQIADAAGKVDTYVVSVSRSVHLPFHSVFKRMRDGKVFRVITDSADSKTPPCATLDISQAKAELWRLTE